MQFTLGDAMDRQLCAVLVHEMSRCQESFHRFTLYAGRNIMGDRAKALVVKSHDAYADFVRHLYELYVGCFKRDRRSDATINSQDLDLLITDATARLLKRRLDAIRAGTAPEWENDASVYDVPVPAEFATEFRRLRNANSHASTKRIVPAGGLALKEFYRKYHKFLHLLFTSAQLAWGGHASRTELGAVEGFDLFGPEP